jgi:hypothetical protein
VIWRSAGAYAFARDGETFTDGGLLAGEPATVHVLDHELAARRLDVSELIELAEVRRLGSWPLPAGASSVASLQLGANGLRAS